MIFRCLYFTDTRNTHGLFCLNIDCLSLLSYLYLDRTIHYQSVIRAKTEFPVAKSSHNPSRDVCALNCRQSLLYDLELLLRHVIYGYNVTLCGADQGRHLGRARGNLPPPDFDYLCFVKIIIHYFIK